MKKTTPASATMGLVALLVLAAGCADPVLPLTGAEIDVLLTGNTIYIKNRNGSEQTAHLRADGTARVVTMGDKKVTGPARWHVMGDTVCHDLRPVYKCYRIWPMEDGGFVAQSVDEAWQPRYAVKKGNPEGL
jgi:hypothetical protein